MRSGDRLHEWLRELGATGALCLPLALAQLGHIAINTTDILMIGRLGPGALASAALGGALYFAVMLFGVGIVSVVAALAAQAHGGRKPRDVRRVVRQGLWVATCFCLPALVVMAFAEPFLLLLHQPVAAARGAAIYMAAPENSSGRCPAVSGSNAVITASGQCVDIWCDNRLRKSG